LSNFFYAGKKPFALISFFLLPLSLLCSGPAQADIYRSLDSDSPTVFTDIPPTSGQWERIVIEKPAPASAEPANDTSRPAGNGRARYASHIEAAALANNVDASLIRAVITAESGYNPLAVSRAGAVGLMQLMPETASRYDVTDSRDPEQNIHGGTRYLRDLLTMFNNDLRLAIAAYNAGELAVMKYGNRIPPYRETLAYVPKVMKFYKLYRNDLAATAKSGAKRVAAKVKKSGAQPRIAVKYGSNSPS